MVVMNFRWSRIWERGNFEFPAVMKKPTIWKISMTITCPITIQHFYDLRLPIIWLDKYIIIQKMSNMKGLYQVPLYYFLCTTDRFKYTHFEAKPENFLCPSLSSSKISVMVFNRFNKLLAISNFNLSVWQYKWLCRFFWKLFLFDWWIPPPLMDIYLSFKVTAKKFFLNFLNPSDEERKYE